MDWGVPQVPSRASWPCIQGQGQGDEGQINPWEPVCLLGTFLCFREAVSPLGHPLDPLPPQPAAVPSGRGGSTVYILKKPGPQIPFCSWKKEKAANPTWPLPHGRT